MIYPLVRELATDGIPVAVTCRVLNIARQPYYRWLADPVTNAELEQAYRANALLLARCSRVGKATTEDLAGRQARASSRTGSSRCSCCGGSPTPPCRYHSESRTRGEAFGDRPSDRQR